MKVIRNWAIFAIVLFLNIICVNNTSGQNVGISDNAAFTPNATAMLDISSTNKGVLLPRVSLSAINTNSPVGASIATGLIVYNTATSGVFPNDVAPGYYWWSGSQWERFSSNPKPAWYTTGNTGTNPTQYFLGTIDYQPIAIRSNNVERMRITPDGEVIIGGTAPVLVGDMLIATSLSDSYAWPVNGYANHNGGGVYGSVWSGTTNFSAVQGEYYGSGAGAGVYGVYGGTSGTQISGVIGSYNGTATSGVRIGVRGISNNGSGNQQMGVFGQYNGTGYGIGVYGLGFGGGIIAGNYDIAVVGWRANNSNYSGYYNGNHVIANGTKSASVGTSKGNQLLYCIESTEVWFEDVGRGKLINGKAEILLDELFMETVIINDEHPMSVFVQEEESSNGLYVTLEKDRFFVTEKNGGTSNINFTYRIMAKRLHFQDHRFGNDHVWGPGDTRKYNQYASPPPINYYENITFQENQKNNWKPTNMPEGFINYFNIQKHNNVIQKRQ